MSGQTPPAKDPRSVAMMWAWIPALVPAVLGTIIGLILLLQGDSRRVQIGIAVPAVFIGTGLLITLVAVLVLVGLRLRARRAHTAAKIAADTAIRNEREAHRRFLARLDHELKNPITAIRATAVAAQNGAAPVDAWKTVDGQATKLSGLVRDLRKLAELETRELETETVNLEDLVHEAVSALGSQDHDVAARTTVSVTRVPWTVPAVVADPDLLSLAIDNVLANAAKYSAGGPIEVRLREESGWAVIEVADTGRGIPTADQLHVFDELARAGNARDIAGSGIGLTLVATVLRRHGGGVALRSAEGAGTVVTLHLPVHAPQR